MDNSPFQNTFNISSKDPFYSQFFQAQADPTNQVNNLSEEAANALAEIINNTSSTSTVLDNEFNEEKLKALCFLAAYGSIIDKNRFNEQTITKEVNLAFSCRRNFFERTIYDIFDTLPNISYEKILPFLDNLNNIFPGLLNENFKDKKARQDADEFIEEVILSSASKPEWPSIYKRDENVEEWISETTDLIVNDIILKNFSKTSFNLSNIRPDQVCKLMSSLYISLSENFLPVSRYFNTESSTSEGLRSISGVIINGLCHIRDGVLSNICREILINRTTDERNTLIKYLKDFSKLNKKAYNLPSTEEFECIGAYAQQILHYRDNIHKLFCNARKFLELETLLPKLEGYNEKIYESEYFKDFSFPLPYSRESISPVGEIIFFLDESFYPLKFIHFNGRQHYTQFVFDDTDKKNEALIMTGNVIKKKFDKIFLSSTCNVILDSNEKIHAAYDDRFASQPSEDWYQKLKNIMIKIDSSFRKIIFKEWEECPGLYVNLPNTNPLVYFLFNNEIFTATDITFPKGSLDNRNDVEIHSNINPENPTIFNHFFPLGCTYSQANYLLKTENTFEENLNDKNESPFTDPEDLAWERIKKYLPINGKITLDWLLDNLSALGELEYNKDRGKGSHYIIKINGYDGFATLSKDFRERLDDTGCFQKYLKGILESIMGDKYSLETFADALEKKFNK